MVLSIRLRIHQARRLVSLLKVPNMFQLVTARGRSWWLVVTLCSFRFDRESPSDLKIKKLDKLRTEGFGLHGKLR